MNLQDWSPIWICMLLFFEVSSLIFPAKKGFNDKFMDARQQLTNNFYQNSKDKNSLNLDTSMLKSYTLEVQSNFNTAPIILRTNNHTLVLNNLDLWVFKNESLQHVTNLSIHFDYDVQIVKGFEWRDRLFLLVCVENSVCQLYSATHGLNFSYHQSISDKGVPTDAHFFVQREELFLAVLFHAFDSSFSLLRIYKWYNLYIDQELIPDIISTASSLTLFGYGEDIVFVLGCFGDDVFRFPSQVWSRKQNGEMTKVQYLPTDSAISITHFMEKGENFILILGRHHDTTIYWWEGSEFVRWLSVSGIMNYFKVDVSSNLKNTTFLIFTFKNILRIYVMTSSELDKVYEREFSSDGSTEIVSILSTTVFEENGITYMLILTKSQSKIHFFVYKVNVPIWDGVASEEPSKKVHWTDTFQDALNTVYHGVKSLKSGLESLDNVSSSVLLTNKDVNISGIVRVSQEVYMERGEIWELKHTQTDISGLINSLYTYITSLDEEIKKCSKRLQTTSVHENRHLEFHGNVFVREAKINSVIAQLVNGNTFEPSSFLSVKKLHSQRLKNVKAKKLKVNWLVVQQIGEKNVKDYLLADSRVIVPVSVAGLKSRNLWIDENMTINNIPVKDLTNKRVTVETGQDTFNKISQVGVGRRAKPGILELQDHTVIQNLNVKLIDDVDISKIIASVFLSNIKNVIYGNVHFKAGIRTQTITARTFNLPIKQSVQPQINNYSQRPLFRAYPPPFSRYWALPNPFILDKTRFKRQNSKGDRVTIKKAKLKIIGDLKVARLVFRNSSLVVNNSSVPTADLTKTFWTSSTPQKINGPVHFTQGISIGKSLKSPIVNGKNLRYYATRTSSFNSLLLENIHVNGNLTTGKNSFWVHENDQQGSVFKLLSVKHLEVKKINGVKSQYILETKDLLEGGINILTGKLNVMGDLEADLINNIDIKQKFKSAVMTDEGFELDDVEFKNISGDNIKVKKMNNHSLESLMKFPSGKNSSVVIHGNIHVSQLSNVKLINNHSADFSKVVHKKKGATIYGKKKFSAQVAVTGECKVTNINNVNLERLYKNTLRVSEVQNITGFYTIRNAEIKSLFNVSVINKVSVSKFTYTSQPQMILTSNIKFKTIAVSGNLTFASLQESCQLPTVEDDIVFEKASEWSTVHISGDSAWSKGADGRLHHLFESAVRTNINQTIIGDVTIGQLSIENITVQSLNNKNISFIFQDSLYIGKPNQVITGNKRFLGSFKCFSIDVKGDVGVKYVNEVDIQEVNENLVRQHGDGKDIIYGHKTFVNGYHAFSLKCREGVNGIKSENIIGRHFTGTAPPLFVHSLKLIGPLYAQSINDLHINSFLQECIYLNNAQRQLIKGQLHIVGNVSLEGEVNTSSINDISTDDVVYMNSKKETFRIDAHKRFLTNIDIETDPNIVVLNSKDLQKTFHENVKLNQNVTINGSVVLVSEVEVATIYAYQYFVGSKQLIYLNKTFSP